MWKNKHVVVALLVAPVLAVIAYFAVDAVVSESPHAARDGASYPLRVMSNCRRVGGECTLQNGDVRVQLRRDTQNDWQLSSTLPLRGALLASDAQRTPTAFVATNAGRTRWQLTALTQTLSADAVLHIAVLVDEANYYAEVPVTFVAR